MPSVKASIPTRIDIAGGTIDLWPIHCVLNQATTVNIGITVDAEVRVATSPDGKFHFVSTDQNISETGDFAALAHSEKLPLLGLLLGTIWSPALPPVAITTTARSPAGAGLGGSSCLGIAIAAALFRLRKKAGGEDIESEEALVRTVQDAEAKLIHAPTGCQDYWGGLRGNVNILTYPYGKIVVRTLPASSVEGLAESLIVCYSGKSRQSAINNWEIFKRTFDRDTALIRQLNGIAELSHACGNAILKGNLNEAVQHSKQEWELRKQLWPNIETTETRAIDQAAVRAGAWFSRVCGAGGGGVMAIFAPPGKRAAVEAAASAAGGTIMAATIARTGLVVSEG
jgi:D-glycero-alpha-D-manno-heptose-7-phosphate kinase